jgi:hypothetical protein
MDRGDDVVEAAGDEEVFVVFQVNDSTNRRIGDGEAVLDEEGCGQGFSGEKERSDAVDEASSNLE